MSTGMRIEKVNDAGLRSGEKTVEKKKKRRGNHEALFAPGKYTHGKSRH